MKIPPLTIKKGFVLSVEAVVGREGYSFNDRDRLNYSRDANFRSAIEAHYSRFENFPEIVVWPKTTVQLAQLVRVASRYGVPITPYGGGSGVCGGAVPTRGGMLVDLKKMQRLLRVDESRLFAEAEAGIYGIALEKELERKGFTLGHFPSSIHVATLGGYLAARSAGQHSNKYGKIEDMAIDLEFVDGKGETHRTSDLSRRAGGIDLTQAIVGSEGTLGLITKARIKVYPLPEARRFASFRFPRFEYGVEALRRILQSGIAPDVLRLYDEWDSALMLAPGKGRGSGWSDKASSLIPDPLKNFLDGAKSGLRSALLRSHRLVNAVAKKLPLESLLVVMCEGDERLAKAERDAVAAVCLDMGGRDAGEDPAAHWHEHRYSVAFKAPKLFQEGAFTDTMEVAATWADLPALYRGVREAVSSFALVLAHISHVYADGAAIYFTFVAPLSGASRSLKTYDRLWYEALSATQKYGGVISHHHGVGRLKAPFLKQEWGEAAALYRRLKKFLDPDRLLNPGVLLPEEAGGTGKTEAA